MIQEIEKFTREYATLTENEQRLIDALRDLVLDSAYDIKEIQRHLQELARKTHNENFQLLSQKIGVEGLTLETAAEMRMLLDEFQSNQEIHIEEESTFQKVIVQLLQALRQFMDIISTIRSRKINLLPARPVVEEEQQLEVEVDEQGAPRTDFGNVVENVLYDTIHTTENITSNSIFDLLGVPSEQRTESQLQDIIDVLRTIQGSTAFNTYTTDTLEGIYGFIYDIQLVEADELIAAHYETMSPHSINQHSVAKLLRLHTAVRDKNWRSLDTFFVLANTYVEIDTTEVRSVVASNEFPVNFPRENEDDSIKQAIIAAINLIQERAEAKSIIIHPDQIFGSGHIVQMFGSIYDSKLKVILERNYNVEQQGVAHSGQEQFNFANFVALVIINHYMESTSIPNRRARSIGAVVNRIKQLAPHIIRQQLQ